MRIEFDLSVPVMFVRPLVEDQPQELVAIQEIKGGDFLVEQDGRLRRYRVLEISDDGSTLFADLMSVHVIGPEKLCSTRKFSVESFKVLDGAWPPRSVAVVRVKAHAVVVIPRLPGEVVLIRSYRWPLRKPLLEFPAGTIDEGETPERAAYRELQEETGYSAGLIEPLGSFYASPGYSDEILHAFLATRLRKGEQDLQPGERITLCPVEPATFRAMLRDGRMQDAKSIAAWCLLNNKESS